MLKLQKTKVNVVAAVAEEMTEKDLVVLEDAVTIAKKVLVNLEKEKKVM
jgi:hypothetical protein